MGVPVSSTHRGGSRISKGEGLMGVPVSSTHRARGGSRISKGPGGADGGSCEHHPQGWIKRGGADGSFGFTWVVFSVQLI
jgi:hypothetical protein